jgi:hypothetical protein
MISLNKRTLPTLITYTQKKGLHLHKTQPPPFIYLHLIIQMMCFIFKMQLKLIEFMSYSQ